MSEPISDAAIERSTGQSWTMWLSRMEEIGARDMPHKDIAAQLVSQYGVDGWWAQMLTVRYEQVIGRREPGQNNAGVYAVSVSKTVTGSMDQAMHWWLKKIQSLPEFNGVAIVTSSTTETEKWRHYRAALKDGSRVVMSVYEKAPAKSSLGLQHEKLLSAASADIWRAYWKSFLVDEQ